MNKNKTKKAGNEIILVNIVKLVKTDREFKKYPLTKNNINKRIEIEKAIRD